MPELWFTEDYADRRAKGNVPDDVTFHTKPQLAVEMLRAIRSEGRLPCKDVVADCLYGNSPDFRDCLKTGPEACWQVDTFSGHLTGAQLPQNNMITSV